VRGAGLEGSPQGLTHECRSLSDGREWQFGCVCGVAFSFEVYAGQITRSTFLSGDDPRRCPAAVLAATSATELDRATVLTAIEVAEALGAFRPAPTTKVDGERDERRAQLAAELDEIFPAGGGARARERGDPGALRAPPGDRVTRLGQTPVTFRRSKGPQGFNDLRAQGLAANLPTSVDLEFSRWEAMGFPGERTHRERIACQCPCHGCDVMQRSLGFAGSMACCVYCHHEDGVKCGAVKARRAISCLDAGQSARKLLEAGVPRPALIPLVQPIARAKLVDPLEGGHAERAASATERRLSGLSGEHPTSIQVPEGPARQGKVTWCACGCHASPEYSGDAPPGASAELLPVCSCPKRGRAPVRERQKPRSVEKARRKECAKLQPYEAIPDPCVCECHVTDCCKREDGSRRAHADTQGSMFGGCSCSDHDRQACENATRGPRILATKVDTLHLSWHVTLDDDLLDALEKKRIEAQENKRATVTTLLPGVKGIPWQVHGKGGGSVYRYKLSNEYADLVMSRSKSKKVAQLRFELRSCFMWERELEGAWGWCASIANALHRGDGCARELLTRCDLAVDVTGIAFEDLDLDHMVMRANKRTKHKGRASAGDSCGECSGTGLCRCCEGRGELEGAEDVHRLADSHLSKLKTSGFSFGAGGVVARIYDKTREIREKSKEKKWLYHFWAERGWVSSEVVWRVEVQIRRSALKEFVSDRTRQSLSLDELQGFRDTLASLWGYSVGGARARGHTAWMKWCLPSDGRPGRALDSRRSRWDARPEWKLMQAADWSRCEPYELARVKKVGAKYEALIPQFVGLGVSLTALRGAALDGQEARFSSYEPDAYDIMKRRSTTWAQAVNERRVSLALHNAVILTDEERRALEPRKPEKRKRMLAVQMADYVEHG
jgi:hypothetical protein